MEWAQSPFLPLEFAPLFEIHAPLPLERQHTGGNQSQTASLMRPGAPAQKTIASSATSTRLNLSLGHPGDTVQLHAMKAAMPCHLPAQRQCGERASTCWGKKEGAASHWTELRRAERQDSRGDGCTGPPDFISRQGRRTASNGPTCSWLKQRPKP